jgi:hypothetical protein
MNIDVLRARTVKWPVSAYAPEGVADLLTRSRQLFIDGYFPYENFLDAGIRSIQAVEAALRSRYNAAEKTGFAKLIDRAHADGLVDDHTQDILHTGRRIHNDNVHATQQFLWPPAIAANVIRTSHILAARLFESPSEDSEGP